MHSTTTKLGLGKHEYYEPPQAGITSSSARTAVQALHQRAYFCF